MMDQLNHHWRGCYVSKEQAPRDHQFSEETMLNIHNDGSSPSRVTVTFADGALSFTLSKDATFEDLADRLDRLGERHHGAPVAIDIKLAAASDVDDPSRKGAAD
jgi:hypothetical protein